MLQYRVVSLAIALTFVCCLCIADPAEKSSQSSTPKRTLVESIQPDYAKWLSVEKDMTEAEVKKLLGNPLEETGIPKEYLNDPSYVNILKYGRLRFDTPSLPQPFEFFIMIKQGKVLDKRDPFDGVISSNRKPTPPSLLLPANRQEFHHYPRFVDLRWNPSSGLYPIEYKIEVEYGSYHQIDEQGKTKFDFHPFQTLQTDCPYCAFAFAGEQHGRWRVKAKNSLGESAWTDWRIFSFDR